MKKTLWILVAVAIILAIVISGTDSGKDQSIKIGALLILSGDTAVYGEGAKQGIELAVEDFTKAHPDSKIEVVYEDTHGEAKQAVSSYQKLVGIDQVDAIVGPLFQTQVGAIVSLVEKGSTPVIAVSPLPIEDRSMGKNPLGFWPDPTIESGVIAKHVFDKGIRKVGVIGTQDSWENEVTNGFVKKFTELGGTITDLEIVLPASTDVRLAASKVIASKPEAVYLGTYLQFIRTFKTLKEQGFKGPFYSIEVDSYLVDETKPASDGLQFVSLDLYSNNFSDRIEARYGQKPSIPVGQAYDAMTLLLSLFEKHKTSEKVLEALAELESYSGVSGEITFGEDNRAAFPTPIFEVRNGVIIKI